MCTNNNYDYIIIGAGCAGLSLAYRLVNTKYKVCILESNEIINKKNKLWSFWDTYKTPFNHLVKKKWTELLIKNNYKEIKINCDNYTYQSIDSHDFNNYILDKIKKSNNIEIKFSSKVENIKKIKNKISLLVGKNTFTCNHIFDSRPNIKKIFMRQQFFGAYVLSEENIFNVNRPMFMDFSNKLDKFHFNYVLPFSENFALIESTYFSSKKEKEMLDLNYIDEYMNINYKGKKYTIEKTEFGSIPMDTNINSMSEKYITKIGSFSGATRASTGYTFINIQKQSDDLVKLLPNISSMKTKKNFHPLVLRKMDDIFLNIVSENPNYMKNALMNLFDSKSHESQIRFLSDTPSILDIFKIIFYLPKIEFLKYSFGFGEKNGK